MVRRKTKRRGTSGRRKTIKGGSTNINVVENATEADIVKNILADLEMANSGNAKIQVATVLFNYLATARYLFRNNRFKGVVMEKMREYEMAGPRYEAPQDFYESIDRLQRHIDSL
jgi:hypothetical protein